jgi:hypothetical protein
MVATQPGALERVQCSAWNARRWRPRVRLRSTGTSAMSPVSSSVGSSPSITARATSLFSIAGFSEGHSLLMVCRACRTHQSPSQRRRGAARAREGTMPPGGW